MKHYNFGYILALCALAIGLTQLTGCAAGFVRMSWGPVTVSEHLEKTSKDAISDGFWNLITGTKSKEQA